MMALSCLSIKCRSCSGRNIDRPNRWYRKILWKIIGLYPTDDHLKAAQIDQFIDFATDLTPWFPVLIKPRMKTEVSCAVRIGKWS